MKKLNLLLLAFLAVMGVTFQSCDDDDGYSLGDVAVDWATVNVKGAHVYDFTGDRWGQIWPATTDYFWYSPIDDNGLFFISILCMIIIRKDMIAQSKC